MSEEEIKIIRDWVNSLETDYSYSHTEDADREDIIFIHTWDIEDFMDFLNKNIGDMICIPAKVGYDGIWFSSDDLRNTKFL